jgi:hypothetical protein
VDTAESAPGDSQASTKRRKKVLAAPRSTEASPSALDGKQVPEPASRFGTPTACDKAVLTFHSPFIFLAYLSYRSILLIFPECLICGWRTIASIG